MVVINFDRFLNKDKTEIMLPVPLGSKVFSPRLTCCDACAFQSEKFDSIFPQVTDGRCGVAPCHTIFSGVDFCHLTLSNLDPILLYWGEKYFATEDEAREKGESIARKNREILTSHGFKLLDNGYSDTGDS